MTLWRRIVTGDGRFQINERTLEDYFGRETSRMVVNQPFEVTNTRNRFDVIANVVVDAFGLARDLFSGSWFQ